MTKCKGCGAEIRWIKTPAGKDMPVNFNSVLAYVPRVLPPDVNKIYVPINVYIPHWHTCQNAKDFKRKKRRWKSTQ